MARPDSPDQVVEPMDIYHRRIYRQGVTARPPRDSEITYRAQNPTYALARSEQEELAQQAWNQFGDQRAISWLQSFNLAVARRKDGDCHGALELSERALEHFRLLRFPPNGGQVFKQLSLCLSGIARSTQG
jgi:hypothetical protein